MKPIYLSSLAGAALLLLSCSGDPVPPPPVPPRPVHATVVKEPAATTSRSYYGVLEPAEGTGLAFEVSGRIVEMKARTGASFEAGDVLAQLDPATYRAQLEAAKAQEDQARQEEGRARLLWENQNIAQAEFDASVTALRAARANREAAQKAVDDCTLKMPYDGVVASVDAEVQTVVTPGQAAVTLQGNGGMEFTIGVPADLVGEISEGLAATVALGPLPEVVFPATVTEVGTQPSQNTTYPVTLSVAATPAARAGMDGEATITLPIERPPLSVPVEAVFGAPPGDQFVWVVQDMAVSKRGVKVGDPAPGGHIHILSGLEPGETVVTRGVQRLEEGQPVSLPASP